MLLPGLNKVHNGLIFSVSKSFWPEVAKPNLDHVP